MIEVGNALIFFRKRENKTFEIILNSKNLDDLNRLQKYSLIIQREIDKYVEEFEKKKEVHGDLVFYYFKPKYPVTSPVSTIISLKDKGKTFIFIVEQAVIKISARNQSGKVNLPQLLNKSMENIPHSSGGGHFSAAGAQIPKEYLKKFKENLIKEYNKLK